ncbi:MAG TPA: hypothetical protein VLK84_03885 [Longimicrobium sp.]|nr:hypothetical protein [Longimicrobium sp.]
MITFVQQLLACGFLLLYGVLALQVWRRAGPVRHDRATLAWGVTAAYFLLTGVYSTGQSVLAAVGWSLGKWRGKESALLQWVATWSVGANLARGLLGVVFALILLALLVTRRRWALRAAHLAPVLLTVCVVVFTAVAVQMPSINNLYGLGTGGAVLSTITAVILMGALLAAVLNDGIDQLLWLSLALYTLKETLSVSLFTLIAWWSVIRASEAWYFFYWVAVGLALGMSLLAARRLRLAGAGERVPALFERMYTLRSPVT